jgi:phenylalanyl-tRNA synthetase beta chain
MAQPMHAFDADRLVGRTIYVRCAKPAEICQALNGEFYRLNSTNLVIADEGGAVAIAGVIGGQESAITAATTRIVLESANFDAACIRKTSSALKLRTDASIRFEKAQDPANTVRALARAVELLRLVAPGIRVSGGLIDNYRPAPAPAPIELPHTWLERKLGRAIEPVEVRRILEALQFGVAERDSVYFVTVPSWRATKDITLPDDLVEEIGRMIGYATIPPAAPLLPAARPWINEERRFHHGLRQVAAAQGFTETYSYSFISEDMARLFGMDPAAHLRVLNPISSEQSLMRVSLLPGMHKNILENAKRFASFRLFEIGKEIHKRSDSLPDEIPCLMAAIYAVDDGKSSLLELKRLAGCLMPGCDVRPAAARPYEHPARSAEVSYRGETLGRLFELHPSLVEPGRAAILNVDLARLFAVGKPPVQYKPLNRYPVSAFDLSVLAGMRTLIADVHDVIQAAVKADSVEYLYTYRGQPLPDDRQSITFRITVSADDHTLSNEEVTAIRNAVIERLRRAGYDLRV